MTKLYKYLSARSGKLVLEDQTLRYSKPVALNDPYDVQLNLRIDFDDEKLKEEREKFANSVEGQHYIKNMLARVNQVVSSKLTHEEAKWAFCNQDIKELYRILENAQITSSNAFRNCKILCFSQEPASALMWAHYSESHQGIVLEFENFTGIDPDNCPKPEPVIYQEEIPKFVDGKRVIKLSEPKIAHQVCNEAVDKHIFTKSKEWEYEREMRIWIGAHPDDPASKEDAQNIPFKKEYLKGVILGWRIKPEDEEYIKKIISKKYPDVKLYKMQKNTKKFQYDIVPYEG